MLTNKQLEEVKRLSQPLIDYIRKETDWIPNININNTEINIKAIDIQKEKILSESGYKTSLDELKGKANFVIALLNKTLNDNLSYKWEIVKSFLNRDEMINIIQHNLNSCYGFYDCPSNYDELKDKVKENNYCSTSSNCLGCWMQIFDIDGIKFKGE